MNAKRAGTARELEFRVTIYVDSETEAVRVSDEWRNRMSAATREWAEGRGFLEREPIPEGSK